MDPNETLRELRDLIQAIRVVDDDPESNARVLADRLEALDDHLTGGGTPPEAWREGPDAVGECTHDTVVMGRCDTCGAYPHGHYEPLGAPNPAHSELPGIVSVETDDRGDLVVGIREDRQ